MPIRGGCVPGEQDLKDTLIKIPTLDEEAVSKAARLQVLSASLFLKDFINDSLSSLKQVVIKRKPGKGNVDEERLEKVKEFMRKRHPQGVRIIEVAEYVGCTQNKAARLLDDLSEGSEFLVYMDDEVKPTRFHIFKDDLNCNTTTAAGFYNSSDA